MAFLPIIPLDLRLFSYNQQKGVLTCEASTLNLSPDDSQWLQQIYDDAADVGIAIRSHYTGRLVRFALQHIDMRHGDLRAWEFIPISEEPSLNLGKVVIFND